MLERVPVALIRKRSRAWMFLLEEAGELGSLMCHFLMLTKLTHIGSIRNDTKQRAIFQMITRNINRQSFPMHFVLNAKFNIITSKLLHKVASNHTIKRLLDAHRDVQFDFGS